MRIIMEIQNGIVVDEKLTKETISHACKDLYNLLGYYLVPDRKLTKNQKFCIPI